MIEADIAQHCDTRIVQRNRTIALINLGDEHAPVPNAGAGEWRIRAGKVLHHRAVHDRRIAPGRRHDPPGHPGDRAFAAGPANRDPAGRGIEQHSEQLGARQARAAQFTRANHLRHRILDRRRGNQRLRRRDDPAAVLRIKREAQAFQPGKLFRRSPLIAAAVRPGHFGPGTAQDQRQRQHARSADAAKEPGVRCEGGHARCANFQLPTTQPSSRG